MEESESEKEDMSDYGGSDSSEEMASEEEDQLRQEELRACSPRHVKKD